MVCHPWARALATINRPTKYEISNSTQYKDMKTIQNVENGGGLG